MMDEVFEIVQVTEGELVRRQFWPTETTNNFGSKTTVTIYGSLTTVTSVSSDSTIVYTSTQPTATVYSTPTPSLTTIFTPPASCLSQIIAQANIEWQIAPLYMTQCYPFGYATSIYYSPG